MPGKDCNVFHSELALEIENKVEVCKSEILNEIRQVREDLERGFPKTKTGEPDFMGHADYHSRMIKAAEEIGRAHV